MTNAEAGMDRSPRGPVHLGPDGPGEQGDVTIRFLGAARTTTGSLHRVRTPEGDLVLDCGTYQGHREESEHWNRRLPLDPQRVKAVVISHAHVDHCGALPNLIAMGYRGPVWCTPATADLLPIMLLDAAHLQENDVERVNRGLPREQWKRPLFTVADVEQTVRLIKSVSYGRDFDPMRGVNARFVDAGHILGSASVHLTLRGRDGSTTTLGFTGDLGRRDIPLLRDPEPLGAVDWYITESTYGDREHEDESGVSRRLAEVVRRATGRGGKVLIPAFAVGRTQLLVYLLHRLSRAQQIPDVPIYVDSPMARRVTEVFRHHMELFDEEATKFAGQVGPLFDASGTSFVEDQAESKAINRVAGPAVIISASGMLEGGRVVHHLLHQGGDPRNIVLFVGYQAEHTLGRRLQDGATQYRALGEQHTLRAETASIEGLSAHADRRGLVEYVERLGREPKRTFLVHGEEDKIEALRGYLASRGHPGAVGPSPGQWFRLL